MPEPGLAGRAALVTGGGRGIGRGISLALAARGAGVALTYRRDAEAAAEVAEEIVAQGGKAVAVQAAMEEPADLERAVTVAREAIGPLDILVSNAGLASRGLPIAETDPEEVLRLFSAHALAAHRLVGLLLPQMRERPRGDVIVVSSSEVTSSRALGAPYNMAKSALESFALTLANEEAANGIRVNVVAPGLVATEMGARLVRAKLGKDRVEDLDREQPFGRVTRPADVGNLIALLVSAEAELVTGQRIVIDGGADASPTGSPAPASP